MKKQLKNISKYYNKKKYIFYHNIHPDKNQKEPRKNITNLPRTDTKEYDSNNTKEWTENLNKIYIGRKGVFIDEE